MKRNDREPRPRPTPNYAATRAAIADFGDELILYGGFVARRADAFNDALGRTGSLRAADELAFRPRPHFARPEDVVGLPALTDVVAAKRCGGPIPPARYSPAAVLCARVRRVTLAATLMAAGDPRAAELLRLLAAAEAEAERVCDVAAAGREATA